MDETKSAKSVTLKVYNKILYRKIDFLTLTLIHLLCKALIQPPLKYTLSAWYWNVTKKLKQMIQTGKNKCMYFCFLN